MHSPQMMIATLGLEDLCGQVALRSPPFHAASLVPCLLRHIDGSLVRQRAHLLSLVRERAELLAPIGRLQFDDFGEILCLRSGSLQGRSRD